jgi:cyclohexyl-isocyanide hydratase
MVSGAERLNTGLVLFPGITPLDVAGPYEGLARAPQLDVLLIAKTKGEVRSELGLALIADEDFASAPDLNVLCVPGGRGARPLCHLDLHGCGSCRRRRSSQRLP